MVSARDTFASSIQKLVSLEKSSGYRPYLIFLGMAYIAGAGLCLCSETRKAGVLMIVVPTVAFILHYFVMSFVNPDFPRSEKHVETMRKLALGDNLSGEKEYFPTESVKIEALPPPTEKKES